MSLEVNVCVRSEKNFDRACVRATARKPATRADFAPSRRRGRDSNPHGSHETRARCHDRASGRQRIAGVSALRRAFRHSDARSACDRPLCREFARRARLAAGLARFPREDARRGVPVGLSRGDRRGSTRFASRSCALRRRRGARKPAVKSGLTRSNDGGREIRELSTDGTAGNGFRSSANLRSCSIFAAGRYPLTLAVRLASAATRFTSGFDAKERRRGENSNSRPTEPPVTVSRLVNLPDEQRLLWLRRRASRQRAIRLPSGLSAYVKRRGRDSNSRPTEPPVTVFETAAFDRSATPPRPRGSLAGAVRTDPPR